MSWLNLARRTCIVTGAGSGIGAAVVKALVEAHCNVVMADRSLTGMVEVKSEIYSSSHSSLRTTGQIKIVECDVTDPCQVRHLVQVADEYASSAIQQEEFSKAWATLLVNCAGITRDNWISRMNIDEWDEVIDVNLKATYLTCRTFLDQERIDLVFPKCSNQISPNCGAIVNVGSIVSERGNLGQVNYAASKGGVLGLTRALAKEVAIRNVNVNAVVPGFIHSPMSRGVPVHVKERMILQTPKRRFGNPNEVADLVCFLLSPRSSYITGESVTISGMIAL